MSPDPGAVMPAHGLGRIIESRRSDWLVGDVVFGWLGWQSFAAVGQPALLWKVDLEVAPPEAWLSILGLNGLTARLGFHHLGSPKTGKTIMVRPPPGALARSSGSWRAKRVCARWGGPARRKSARWRRATMATKT